MLNDAPSIYFLDATLASVLVARWCAGHRVEAAEGVSRIRADEPTARIGAAMQRMIEDMQVRNLSMDGAGVRRAGHEGDGPRVLQIAHVDDADAVRIAVADIGIASMHHDLDAIATPALVGVTDGLD